MTSILLIFIWISGFIPPTAAFTSRSLSSRLALRRTPTFRILRDFVPVGSSAKAKGSPTEDDDGDIDPEVAAAVRDNLRYLMVWLWDQHAEDGDPDLEELFEYVVETVRGGHTRLAAAEEDEALYDYCTGSYDYDVREQIPFLDRLRFDPHYSVRAWQAVLYVFLTDHLFVLEGGE